MQYVVRRICREVGCRLVSHLLSAAPPEQVGLAPDNYHVVPRPRRRRVPAGFQLSPLAMTISVPSSFTVGVLLCHLLHAAFHTVHRRVLGPHAVGKRGSRRTAGGRAGGTATPPNTPLKLHKFASVSLWKKQLRRRGRSLACPGLLFRGSEDLVRQNLESFVYRRDLQARREWYFLPCKLKV